MRLHSVLYVAKCLLYVKNIPVCYMGNPMYLIIYNTFICIEEKHCHYY